MRKLTGEQGDLQLASLIYLCVLFLYSLYLRRNGCPNHTVFSPLKGSDYSSYSSSEDKGYLLSLLFNGKTKRSEVVILSAETPSAGPLARIQLDVGIPHGNHGYFCSDEGSTWSSEEINRRARFADKIEAKGNRWNEVKSDFSGLGI